MKSCLSEMLHCLNTNSESSEMSQHSRLKWHQDQDQDQSLSYGGAFLGLNGCDPGLANDDFPRFLNYGNGSDFEISYALPRTLSCPPNVAEAAPKKRKADKTLNLKAVEEDKKMKGFAEEESKITTEQNSNSNNKSTTTTTTSTATNNNKATKANTKVSESPKTDYIHVRARRGQATDSHSLAERVRREKISERMKYLQDLVPGCNKITGKAGMLDEIINYVQSLQRQVEFLSMKLATINPRLDFDVENYLVKEIFPACTSSVPTIGASSSDMVHLQFNTLGQSSPNLEMVANPMDIALRRTISAPVTIPQTFLDSSSLNQIQHATWENEIHNLYSMEYHQQGRSPSSFITQQPFTGFQEPGHVKLEM